MTKCTNISVIGAGAFGVTMANHIAKKKGKYEIKLYTRNSDNADYINKNHYSFRLQHLVSEDLTASNDLSMVLQETDVIVSAIVSYELRNFLKKTCSKWPERIKSIPFISVSKGLDTETGKRMSEIIIEELNIPSDNIAVLSGPNLAVEIVQGKSASSVIACKNNNIRQICHNILQSDNFQIYDSEDVSGVELCGAAKNVVAIAAGMSFSYHSEPFGENARAALAVLATEEIKKIGSKITPKIQPDTIYGLAGIGDIMVTSTSPASRNYQFGWYLGKGYSPKKALKIVNSSVEGYYTVQALHKLAQKNHCGVDDIPIIDAIYDVVDDYNQETLKKAIQTFRGG